MCTETDVTAPELSKNTVNMSSSSSTTFTENPSGAQTSESTKTLCELNVPWSGTAADAAAGADTANATTIVLRPAARRTQALFHMRSLDISHHPPLRATPLGLAARSLYTG